MYINEERRVILTLNNRVCFVYEVHNGFPAG